MSVPVTSEAGYSIAELRVLAEAALHALAQTTVFMS